MTGRALVLVALALALLVRDGKPSTAQPVIFTVTSTNDNGGAPGNGLTLRQAVILAGENGTERDTINFAIVDPEFGRPVASAVIALLSPIEITSPVLIDGTTQQPSAGKPVIEITKGVTDSGDPFSGIVLDQESGGSTIRGLSVTGFTNGGNPSLVKNAGIDVGTSNNVITDNYIGLSTDASQFGNDDGVDLGGNGSNNTVGPNNVISANRNDGVHVFGSNNFVRGNEIGVDPSGSAEAPNERAGVYLGVSASNNTVGGSAPGDRNVISGNLEAGIDADDTTGLPPNIYQGNYIGTDASGTAAIGNGTGISLSSTVATIGGTGAGEGNLISGNEGDGISALNANGTVIEGNRVGTDAGGTSAIPNGGPGVHVTGGAVTIDGANLISGNSNAGIYLNQADGTVVEGNRIGPDASGSQILGNGLWGIHIDSGSNYRVTGNVISGNGSFSTDPESGLTTFNGGRGIEALFVDGLTVDGNLIGTTPAGDAALSNQDGIILESTSNVTIGGAAAGAGNVISGNQRWGILLACGDTPDSATTIQGNMIGTNGGGTAALPNGSDGIAADCGTGTLIGGADPGAGNVISGNLGSGISDAGTDDVVQGNRIGVGIGDGPLGNGRSGVDVHPGAPAITDNTIAFNTGDGVTIAATNNPIMGNRIYQNGGNGVTILAGGRNPIQGNFIHDNVGLGIDLNGDGVTGNDTGDGDDGPNQLQNYPVLDTPSLRAGEVFITGSLNSTPNSTFTLEFFANSAADGSGNGEGETPLAPTTQVTTDGAGNASFVVDFPEVAGEPFITATATTAGPSTAAEVGDTSEFSAVVQELAQTTLTTQASAQLNGSIIDTATLSGGVNPGGTIDFKLFGPSDTACAGPPLFVTSVPVTDGNGQYVTPPFTPPGPGVYRWLATYAGDAQNAAAPSPACDDPTESVVVEAPAPTITTQASPGGPIGVALSDTAAVSGGSTPTGGVSFALYGPNDPTCTGAPVSTSTALLDATFKASSTPFTPTAPGTYRWLATYGGDDGNPPAGPTACGDPAEQAVVTAAPTIATTATPATAPVPSQITDTATLTGGANPTGSITFRLFGPTDTTCTGTPALTSTKTVTGNGTYTSDPYTATTPGAYRWIAAYSGDVNNAAVTGLCGDANETTDVTPPASTTTTTTTLPPSTTTTLPPTTTTTTLPPTTTTTTTLPPTTTTTLPPTTTTTTTTLPPTTTTTLPPTTTTTSTTLPPTTTTTL
ncbi:MAG: right-handed parallel beta-helix repeat-containing protein, partial [Actinomycetota bacterium]|nr:right-handed parallel beta-helix repeat-containing protein [Actinomycetota bacterium]